MSDFIERNSLIVTDEGVLATTSPPVRGSVEWLDALSEEVNHELSDSLARQTTAKKVGGIALLELDDVIGKMRSHTRLSQDTRSQGNQPADSAPVSAFKPSAMAAYGLEAMEVGGSLLSEPLSGPLAEPLAAPLAKPSQLLDSQRSDLTDSVRASWPLNWSVLRVSDFQVPKLKIPGRGKPSPSV